MLTFGLILSILVTVSSAVLLVTVKDDALASTLGMAFTILGSVLCGFYYAMLTGW